MPEADAPDEPQHPRPTRRVTVPISFTGDIAGFLFDLLSDIEAIVWEADADTLAVEFVNDRVLDLLGYEPMDLIAVPDFWSETVVHPDDRELYRASSAVVLAEGVSRVTYRALSRDQRVVWLSSVAHLTIDQEGRRRIRGLETDVTAMKRAEEQARESEERFRLLSEASRDSVIVHTGGTIVEVNQAFCDQFGWSADEALALRPEDYIAPESIAVTLARLADGTTGAFELTGVHRSGARRWYAAQSQETRYHGRLARVVVLTDITDLKEREERALHDANHDQLTGLPNRAAFERRLDLELARHEPGHVLGMLFCDLNGFKRVNDDHGHAAGDSLLRLVAQRLGSVVRTSDPVFRLGGDEFVILLPLLPEADAERVVDVMRRRLLTVFAPSFSVGPAAVHVGVAVGTAMCPRDGITAGALVGHADTAMYVHKRMTKSKGGRAA
ncbi:MAG TPA: diguanylate cyclase [Gaiellales bacterium]|jgi:diguanylate cyclase (GGDEF)-like protein/PAS domain S-box-containing protein